MTGITKLRNDGETEQSRQEGLTREEAEWVSSILQEARSFARLSKEARSKSYELQTSGGIPTEYQKRAIGLHEKLTSLEGWASQFFGPNSQGLHYAGLVSILAEHGMHYYEEELTDDTTGALSAVYLLSEANSKLAYEALIRMRAAGIALTRITQKPDGEPSVHEIALASNQYIEEAKAELDRAIQKHGKIFLTNISDLCKEKISELSDTIMNVNDLENQAKEAAYTEQEKQKQQELERKINEINRSIPMALLQLVDSLNNDIMRPPSKGEAAVIRRLIELVRREGVNVNNVEEVDELIGVIMKMWANRISSGSYL